MSNKIDNMSKNHRSKRSSTNQKPMLVKVNHNRKIDSELYQCEYALKCRNDLLNCVSKESSKDRDYD